MLKRFPKRAIEALTNIIIAMLKFLHFPKKWKNAGFIMLPKAGKDGLFPQNYRSIASINKIAERIIADRMKECTDELDQ